MAEWIDPLDMADTRPSFTRCGAETSRLAITFHAHVRRTNEAPLAGSLLPERLMKLALSGGGGSQRRRRVGLLSTLVGRPSSNEEGSGPANP